MLAQGKSWDENKAKLQRDVGPVSEPPSFSFIFSLEHAQIYACNNSAVLTAFIAVQTWLIGALYWPVVMSFNFRFVPLVSRPLGAAAAAGFWNIYLSGQANKEPEAYISNSK